MPLPPLDEAAGGPLGILLPRDAARLVARVPERDGLRSLAHGPQQLEGPDRQCAVRPAQEREGVRHAGRVQHRR